MKRAAFLLLCSVLFMAIGALLHCVTLRDGTVRRRVPSGPVRPIGGPRAAFARHDAAGMAAALLEETSREGVKPDRVLLDQWLSAMKPGDYLLVIRELLQRDEKFFHKKGVLQRDLIRRAAAADAKGLLAFAAEEPPSLRPLNAVADECWRYDREAVLAALIRGRAKGAGQREAYVSEMLLAVLCRVAAEDAPATLRAMEGAGLDTCFISPGVGGLGGLMDVNDYHWGTLGTVSPFDSAIAAWARQDAPAAVAFALRHPVLLTAALRAWAGDDIDAAVEWLQGSPERAELVFPRDGNGDPSSATDRLYYEYIKRHPLDAARILERVTDPEFHFKSEQYVMKFQSVEKAAARVQALPEEAKSAETEDPLPEEEMNAEDEGAEIEPLELLGGNRGSGRN